MMPTEPSADRNAILQLQGLTLRRGTKTLLRSVDWTVHPGENWVIMGPNGCGKTSLLRSIIGLITPSAGDIHLLGHTYGETDWRDIRRYVGLVSSALHAHIPPGEPAIETVISGRYDQLDFWGTATPEDIRLARKLLRQLGVGEVTNREWAVLSQGERQRVLIARALAANPALLILDEPCAGLDPVARSAFLQSLDKLTVDGPSLVLVTHHVEEITPGFTHGLLLAQGRRVSTGPLRESLSSAHLSQAFGTPLKVSRTKQGWRLHQPSADS